MRNGALLVWLLVGVGLFALGGASVWLYQQAATYDAAGQQVTFKGLVMQRKSDAMQELMDAVLSHRLPRAGYAGQRLEQYTATIDGYIDTDMYESAGERYRRALGDLRSAINADDWQAARDATLAIERSCFDCHAQLLVLRP